MVFNLLMNLFIGDPFLFSLDAEIKSIRDLVSGPLNVHLLFNHLQNSIFVFIFFFSYRQKSFKLKLSLFILI